MDRSFSNINRNTSNILNHIRSRVVRNNLVTPDIFVSEIWMQDDVKNGVEIIELNSSDVEEAPEAPANNFSQAWSFINNDRFREVDEDYRTNNTARERRRKKNEEKFSIAYENEYLHDHDTQTNFNGFHYIVDSQHSGITQSQQTSCFTIINNHVINSDSSSDNDYTRIEEIEQHFADDEDDSKYWDHVYNEDVMMYDLNNKPEKRTVWIYSFKNKRRLSENDFELVNITGKDSGTSTSNSLSDEEHKNDKGSNGFRIASPIPATFIPRLDLSLAQTLSTVTEISEAKNSSNESLVVKPINNWLTDRNVPKSKKETPDIVSWMGLSPRERRRRFKNTNHFETDYKIEPNSREFTYAEGITQKDQEKPRKPTSLIKVDVEVHATDVPDITPEKPTDVELVSIESFEMEPQVKKKINNPLSIEILYADADTEIDHEKGDFEFDPSNRPVIQLTSDKTYDVITEPIENLNTSKWIIGDEKIEEHNDAPDFAVGSNESDNESLKSDISDSASRRLWIKSTKLMKSPIWTEFLPITGTPPSLHLSLSSIEGKKSWIKRIAKIFNCCK